MAKEHPTITQAQYLAMRCDNIPTDCVNFGVVNLATGKEVCRVWEEDDCRNIADLLNRTTSLAAQDGLAPLIVAGMNLRQHWLDVDAYISMDASTMAMSAKEMRRRSDETKRDFLDALQAALSAIKGDKS